MSKVYRCDRCGNLFDGKGAVSSKHGLWIGNDELDFCQECIDSLDIWIEQIIVAKEDIAFVPSDLRRKQNVRNNG